MSDRPDTVSEDLWLATKRGMEWAEKEYGPDCWDRVREQVDELAARRWEPSGKP